jgi:iron complex outermembrane receptor protein
MSRNSHLGVRTGVSAAIATLLSIPAAHAQVAAPAPAASGALATVMVTAERRSENVKDVPSSVSTLSGETLDVLNSSGEDVRAISGRVPSLNIESSFGRAFPRFYIRGYGNTDFRLNASQPVSLVYDDVVQENPILKGFPAFDLEQIEVLAGPQGSLFGRNTPAGVVKFDSVTPSQRQEGYLNLGYGRFGTSNVEGAYNLPLGGAWAARISALVQHRDDWVTNTAPTQQTHSLEGYDDRAIRGQALWKPGSDFSALFNLHARDLKGSARLFRANIIKPGTDDLVDAFDPSKISIDGKNEQTLHTFGGSARLTWKLADGILLHSITGYETVNSFSRGDVDGGYGAVFAPPSGPGLIPFPSETADSIHGHDQITQEFRVESAGAGPLKWQGGVYYFHEKYEIDAYGYDSLGGGAQTSLYRTEQKNDSYAAFGSVNYDISPVVKVRGGLRYTHDKKDLSTEDAPGIDKSNGLAKGTSDSKLNWDLSGTYAVTPDANLYARAATGYRGSSIQPASGFGALTSAGPETNLSFEVGFKADLLDKRARTSLSLYQYRVKDQQLTAVGGASNTTILLNAKKAIGRGVEATFDARPVDNLLVNLSGSYNFTRIKDPSLVVGVCAQCTVTNPTGTVNGQTVAFIDGNALPNAPKWIGNANLRYGIPDGNGGEYFVFTDWTYRSKVNFFLYESIEFTGKSLLQGGLRLGYSWANGKYEAAAFARNITNQIKVTGAIDFNNLTGFINDPRTFGVQFKALF